MLDFKPIETCVTHWNKNSEWSRLRNGKIKTKNKDSNYKFLLSIW
jgi:hypothetical protein